MGTQFRKAFYFILVFILLMINNCLPMGGDIEMAGGFVTNHGGATQGGTQDIGYFRHIVSSGSIPASSTLTYAGLFSEHDIPITGPPCADDFCIRTALGVQKELGAPERSAFIQLGLLSGIDLNNFQRPPLNVSVVVDVSGSMTGGSIEAVKTALSSMVEQLDGNDTFSVVLFNSYAWVLIAPQPVTNVVELQQTINEIFVEGSTNVYSGLLLGYNQVELNQAGFVGENRLILFTDAMANTGETSPGAFDELVQSKGLSGIGLTAFGVGISFNHNLVEAITRTRGGNYFYLESEEKIRTVFDVDFDYLVTPLGYDVTIEFLATPGLTITNVYGIPGVSIVPDSLTLQIPTIFLSRNRGAIIVKTEFINDLSPGSTMANSTLSYLQNDLAVTVTSSEPTVYNGSDVLTDSMVYHSQEGVRRAVALIEVVTILKEVCDVVESEGDIAGAKQRTAELLTFLESEALIFTDADFQREVDLVRQFQTNLLAIYP